MRAILRQRTEGRSRAIYRRKEGNEGGRPRVFANEDLFQAATRALMQNGYSRLTLEQVAREAGCTSPALVRRFGSKRGLIQAYLEWTIPLIQERFRATRLHRASPLEALRARYLLPQDRPEEFGLFTRWTEALSDPELAPAVWRIRQIWEGEAAFSLAQARDAGELVQCDVEELARTLVAALAGAAVLSSPEHERIDERIAAIFDLLIGQFRA